MLLDQSSIGFLVNSSSFSILLSIFCNRVVTNQSDLVFRFGFGFGFDY